MEELLELDKKSWKERLFEQKEEQFDSEYVQAVQKDPNEETQKTIRHYQWIVALIKIASKIALVLNVQNILKYFETIGIRLGV